MEDQFRQLGAAPPLGLENREVGLRRRRRRRGFEPAVIDEVHQMPRAALIWRDRLDEPDRRLEGSNLVAGFLSDLPSDRFGDRLSALYSAPWEQPVFGDAFRLLYEQHLIPSH